MTTKHLLQAGHSVHRVGMAIFIGPKNELLLLSNGRQPRHHYLRKNKRHK
jgi:hypothetical protein